jgi:hypothetical protein
VAACTSSCCTLVQGLLCLCQQLSKLLLLLPVNAVLQFITEACISCRCSQLLGLSSSEKKPWQCRQYTTSSSSSSSSSSSTAASAAEVITFNNNPSSSLQTAADGQSLLST